MTWFKATFASITLRWFSAAMENHPFTDSLPVEEGENKTKSAEINRTCIANVMRLILSAILEMMITNDQPYLIFEVDSNQRGMQLSELYSLY